ncbi:hypothetical protein MRY87_13735 [bacterium]|nr:hypothetical protein [bacterium]
MKLFRTLPVFLFFFSLPLPAVAVDLDGDGRNEHFFWSGDIQNTVSVHSADGAFLQNVTLPGTALADPPVLFKGQDGSQAVVFSLLVRKRNQAELLAFSDEGRIAQVPLGDIRRGTVALEDLNGDGTTDVLYTTNKRQLVRILSPTRPRESRTEPLGFRLRRNESFTILNTDPLRIARYGLKKKKTRRVTLQGVDGTRSRLGIRVPKNGSLLPLPIQDGISQRFLAAEQQKRAGAPVKTFFADIEQGGRQALSAAQPVSPGYFVDSGSSIPQIAISRGLSVQIFEVMDLRNPIRELLLDFGYNDIPQPSGHGGNDVIGGNSSGGSCNGTFPQELVDQAFGAFHAGNFARFQSILNTLANGNFCPNIYLQLTDLLNNGLFSRSQQNRSANTNVEYTLLGAPVYTMLKSQKKKAGCDKLRKNGDGPNGWVMKESEVDGTLVTLAPGNFGATGADLVTLRGKRIERLRDTGFSNPDHTGIRRTFRGKFPPAFYPLALIVRFFVIDPLTGEEQLWCFQTKNSHIRND